jgi:hypothetical protein
MNLEGFGLEAGEWAAADRSFRGSTLDQSGDISMPGLLPEQLYQACDAAALPFQTAAELAELP